MGRNDMTFEGDIASLNEHFFFEEFTYSTNTFRPSASTELELADSIIWLDDMLVIFQLKERDKISKTSPENRHLLAREKRPNGLTKRSLVSAQNKFETL